MTGHGQAHQRFGDSTIEAEVRTVNNRFLKVSSKISDSVSSIEPEVEGIVRDVLKRGSVTVLIRVSQLGRSHAATVNVATLESYAKQAESVFSKIGLTCQFNVGEMLQLPGVLEQEKAREDEQMHQAVREVLRDALRDLQGMRAKEGASMADQFSRLLDSILTIQRQIATRVPITQADYKQRLEQRLRAAMQVAGQELKDADLLREVLLFADRTDISEELTRLSSHLNQFREAIESSESQGRRLDFLTQELSRETNTIGSKANDSSISHSVVTIKTIIEQMRELVQNVE
jgi:uncharacterized protein (TIGR00255 family)